MLDKDTGRKESRGDVVVGAFSKGGLFLSPLGRWRSRILKFPSYTACSGP